MARTFDATTESLRMSTPTVTPASAGTIAMWIKPAWNSGDSVTHNFLQCYGNSGGAGNVRMCFEKGSDNNIYVGWFQISPLDLDRIIQADTGLFTSRTWAH